MHHSSTDANAFSLGLGAVDADTPEPNGTSGTSSILRVGTPARHVSIIASPTPVSRRRRRPMIAVASLMPSGLGMRRVTSPDDVARLLS